MTYLGLSGKKHSGKSSIADLLLTHIGDRHPVQIIGFADAVKRTAARMLDIKVSDIEANKEDYRPFLQWLGTTWGRKLIGEDVWLHQLYDEVTKFPKNSFVIVTDVRFLNEAEYIKRGHGKLWRITREQPFEKPDLHVSETELDHFTQWDAVIENDSSMLELRSKVVNLYEEQYGKQKTNPS